ncbi:MAG: Abi family protein [Lachnospiraceae bacterium]|nr:Abi family protein [Lachnospiraceae bacterium]
MPTTKEFRTIEQQIAGLEARQLKFKNKKRAEKILRSYNYFDIINGFETILLKKSNTKEYENVYFEDFWDLYKFDMKLKRMTLFKIFDIESRLRTAIAYHFASVNCNTIASTMNYTDRAYYQAPSSSDTYLTKKFNKFDLFRTTLYWPNGNVKKMSFVDELKKEKDYVGMYQDPPFWVVIKSLPLGSLCFLYEFLPIAIKQLVLGEFGFLFSQSDVFVQAIYILKEVRNQCAHLELLTRFRLKKSRASRLNCYVDITNHCGLSKTDVNYMDVAKVFKTFGCIKDIKCVILVFYIKMCLKGRKKIADKILAKMGRKSFFAWMRL